MLNELAEFTLSGQNLRRFDLSDRLIHFFRPLNLDGRNASPTPETWGPGDLVEDVNISPFFLLRNSVRTGRLWASWSMRGRRRTIYGPHPAVCFTEMPLGAFLEAGEARTLRGEAMSPYGLVFPKAPIFRLGARPAIYGLSTEPAIPRGRGGRERLLPEEALPLLEQYRYVTYSPGRVDWTHEREWRWPCRAWHADEDVVFDDRNREVVLPPADGRHIPGFEFYRNPIRNIGAVVRTRRQRDLLLHDMLTAADREGRHSPRYSFIIAREDLPDLEKLYSPGDVTQAIDAAALTLDDFYSLAAKDRRTLIGDFEKAVALVAGNVPNTYGREGGCCWLWLIDTQHPMARALVLAERVIVNDEGRYLVALEEFDDDTTLGQREQMTRDLASLLSSRFNLRATYHSVLDSYDPDGLPFYCDPPFDHEATFNRAHEKDDF